MLENTDQASFKLPVADIFITSFRSAIVVAVIAAVIFFAALAPLTIALIVLGAAALLLLIGAVAFHNFTCMIKAQYAAGGAIAAAAVATYGFPTYAALKASWPWYVRAVAC